jgi:hypothetical protein
MTEGNQRLKIPRAELSLLLESERGQIYILRDGDDQALGEDCRALGSHAGNAG